MSLKTELEIRYESLRSNIPACDSNDTEIEVLGDLLNEAYLLLDLKQRARFFRRIKEIEKDAAEWAAEQEGDDE